MDTSNQNKKNITASLEDYLETIYFLNNEEGVRVTDIATHLSISKPSVNRAINTLKSQGLVTHEHYGALFLTDEGLKIAKNLAKRHFVLKRFLHKVLKVEASVAEQEACMIEHCLSAETFEKLEKFVDTVLKK
ncbi:MAG: metal-dependent transcriptional regulator [Tyzzerella sp.]|uniref:Manganese transport regulator n=1 Tax=Candidatus Fimicola merdigallinarum TaxID=2840819 RepID=A0A9D9DXS6_9FIRM|nr:metal-dependent transcriptional regulator [Candidatus Fimicola merdigallinarum]